MKIFCVKDALFGKDDTNEACVVCFQDTNDSTNKYQSQVCLFHRAKLY